MNWSLYNINNNEYITLWITIFKAFLFCLLVSKALISLRDHDEFRAGLWVVLVSVGMVK